MRSTIPPGNRPGHHPPADQDKPTFVSSRIELLRERRGEERVSFGDVCDHMNDYLRTEPGDAESLQRFASFLARVEDVDHDHDREPVNGGLTDLPA